LDRRARLAAAAGPARRTLAVQHRRVGAGRADRPGGPAAGRRGAAGAGVFAPLGIWDTAFCTAATGRLATAYRPTPGGLVAWDQPDGAWSHPPAFGDGAAGLVSTVDDLLAFARMLLRGGAPVL